MLDLKVVLCKRLVALKKNTSKGLMRDALYMTNILMK